MSNQNSSESCQKSGKSHKQWEVERKITYLNAHNGDESFKDIVVDRYGNSYIARGKKLTKYNCYQKKVWQVDLWDKGNSSYTAVKALRLDKKFVYVVYGYYGHATIVKYDLNGKRFFIGNYTIPESSNVESMAIDKRGNIIIVAAPSGGSGDGSIAMYDPKGKKLWFKKYPDTYFYDVVIDKHGNLIVVGDLFSKQSSLLVKYDSQGNELWRKTYKKIDKKDVVTFYSVDIDNKNNLYVSGQTSGYKSYILKFTSSGKKLWSKMAPITGYAMTSGSVLLLGMDGKIYLAGRPKYPKGGYKGRESIYRLAVAMYDTNGRLLTKRVLSKEESIQQSATLYNKYGFYQQYQRKDGTFYLVQNGKIIYDNLKYVKILSEEAHGHKLQILDKQNRARIVFIKADEAQSVLPTGVFCGNGSMAHKADIVRRKHHIQIEVKIASTDDDILQQYKDVNKTHSVIKVSNRKVDELFFNKNEKQLIFETNDNQFERTVYYKKGSKYGFWGYLSANYKFKANRKNKVVYSFKKSKNLQQYDMLQFKDKERIIVGKNGMLGYYKITPIKYKTLDDFKESLARFTLPDGRKGYVDLKGNEYYD